MLRSICKTLMIVLATAVIGGTASGATTDAGYRINGGDLLHISVYGEENLNQDVAVQPDGWIAFPLVGNLDARGLTLKELQTKIAVNLRESQYFPNLTDNEVTVSMVKATGNSVSVVGQVEAPGTFAFDTQLDVMQALSLAGGLTPFADKDEIKVLRRDAAGVQTAILFDYSQAEEGQKLDQNILLRGGDVVVVPQGGLF
jgi:polysaccharide biosynthesis/export protein